MKVHPEPQRRIRRVRPRGHIRESAVAVVAVENVLPPIREEEILVAVVIVVADRTADAQPVRDGPAFSSRP